MTSSLNFLLTAKRCEIAELEQLARTSALVRLCAQLVHELQRERGLSNLYLASGGSQFAAERSQQILICRQTEIELRASFDAIDVSSMCGGHGARLYSRIAYALQGLDALPALREQVKTQRWSPRTTTEAYVRLINSLLTVVFEAADSAGHPDISRLLVALFHFMQGKELAGQERAAGSALFASGRAEADGQQRLLHLIDAQERCFEVFAEFASTQTRDLWLQAQDRAALADLERLRRILGTAPVGASMGSSQSQFWFECCSRRIDAMRNVEERLADELLQTCEERMAAARTSLKTCESLQAKPLTDNNALGFFHEPEDPHTAGSAWPLPPGFGPLLERSMLDLVREQAGRLQAMGDELDTVRTSLNERKVVERAKGLLMAHRQLSEEEAHKTMRQMAMNQNRRLLEVADAVLAMADVLPERRR